MSKLSKRKWRVSCWNVRGLNSESRQREVRSKIYECDSDIICLQETKCENFDWPLIRTFCPNFYFSPSVGASGGILVIWNSSVYCGMLVEVQRFGIRINFTSMHNNDSWSLVCVYGPCHGT
jgi:exonuclease III